MICEKCGKDASSFVILPIKKKDGCLNTIVCVACAEDSPAYCKKHNVPHLGFADDNTTACKFCIDELVETNRKHETEIASMLWARLPSGEDTRLAEYAEFVSSITGENTATCVLRALATKAMRAGMSVEEVASKLVDDGSVSFILPPSL